MKTFKLTSLLILLLHVVTFSIISCEPTGLIGNPGGNPTSPNPKPITVDSPLAKLMLRVAKHNVNDKFEDKALRPRCYNFAYPVAFTFNGVRTIIKGEQDFQKIERAILKFMTKEDLVKFSYPLTIIPNNAFDQKYIVTNDAMLRELLVKCDAYEDDDAVDNLDIVYPIAFVIQNQTANEEITKIDSNERLIAFLKKISNETKFTIEYPVNLSYEGNPATVYQNEVFEKIIKDAINQNIKSLTANFENVLNQELIYLGNWTGKLDNNYTFNFEKEGVVYIGIVNSKVATITGEWFLYNDLDETYLMIKVDDTSYASALNKKWKIKQNVLSQFDFESTNEKGIVENLIINLEYMPK
jgi:hypothetical protein